MWIDTVYKYICVLTVPPCAGAHAFPPDQTVCESDATLEGVWFDPERHGSLAASLQGRAGPAAEHHGCVRQGAIAGLEGNSHSCFRDPT